MGSTVIQEVWNGLLDLVYPPVCLVCRQWIVAGALCEMCRQSVAPVLPPLCDRCGVPVPAERIVCIECEEGPEPPFDWSQTMGQYTGPLRIAIHHLKYHGKTALAAPLGQMLAHSLDTTPTPLFAARPDSTLPAFDAVVPIPLHPARLRQRGFNQAERLARVLAAERGWPLDTTGLRRVRRTEVQALLTSREARAANVRNAFVARSPTHFWNQSVLLVDDVLTTMATAREAAAVVRTAGATRICIVALARG
ncbi:MAG: putative amidophosphoribosyltransferase [Chthonomonadaceae bacterium]|nr:putative amidophosphoribosyltransferase [Chthonomonadaceae bacterium]